MALAVPISPTARAYHSLKSKALPSLMDPQSHRTVKSQYNLNVLVHIKISASYTRIHPMGKVLTLDSGGQKYANLG